MNTSPGESYSLMKEIDSKPGHCKRCRGVKMHRIPASIGKLPEEDWVTGLEISEEGFLQVPMADKGGANKVNGRKLPGRGNGMAKDL